MSDSGSDVNNEPMRAESSGTIGSPTSSGLSTTGLINIIQQTLTNPLSEILKKNTIYQDGKWNVRLIVMIALRGAYKLLLVSFALLLLYLTIKIKQFVSTFIDPALVNATFATLSPV